MHIRLQLILSFMLIALIPLSILSAIFAYSMLVLQEQTANVYNGSIEIIVQLGEGSDDLLQIRTDVQRHILTDSAEEKQEISRQIRATDAQFLGSLINYKRITDFPLQIEILESRGFGSMISDEDNMLQKAHSEWAEYQRERDATLVLSDAGKADEALRHWAGPANEKLNELRTTYKSIIDLNGDLARIMYEESQAVVQKAFIYGLVASLASAGSALAVAILFSRKLAPPLQEMEKKAKKEIEKFITSAKPSDSRQADENHAVLPKLTVASRSASVTEGELENDDHVPLGQITLLHAAGYQQDDSPGNKVMDSILQRSSYPEGEKSRLVVMTRKSSNLYHRAQRAGATTYILSSVTQNPIDTSSDGALVISINQTSLILEAIRSTLQGNPSSTVVIDNATELIHRLGFEKVFSLLQNISDIASLHPQSRVIILINKNAHDQGIVEAIANVANAFVE